MAQQAWEYGRVSGEDERVALGELQARVFGFESDRIGPYHELAGHDNLRVIRRAGTTSAVDRLVGGLVILPMGQYFGGRSVSSGGIAVVAIEETCRGLGAGGALMKSVVLEMRDMGLALSSLYASTQTLYRGAGYERAGTSFDCDQELARISVERSPLIVRRFEDSDMTAVARVYSQRARRINGFVDRSAFFWTRVKRGRGDNPMGYVVQTEDGAIEGYVFLTQTRDTSSPDSDFNLACSDLVAITRRAADRLLAFLRKYGSIAQRVHWNGHPTDEMLLTMHECGSRIILGDVWMLRILDVEAALTARGYWPGANSSFVLNVHSDTVLGSYNNGRFDVAIEDSSAQVTRLSGDSKNAGDDVRIHIRGLAPLYSGHLSPWQLRCVGWLEASDEQQLEVLASVFGGNAPWMSDRF